MKYTNSNVPFQCFLTNNPCYKGTKPMTVKGVLWHSTGSNNKTVKRYVQPSKDDPNYDAIIEYIGKNKYNNSWNNTTRKVGMNAFIGVVEATGKAETIQTMPWDWRPWGCGSGKKGSCNSGWIQFEICEDNLKNEAYFNEVYKEACEFTAYMCQMFNLDPQGTVQFNGVTVPVILCHADSCDLGFGSNHGDVLHWFKKYGKTMQDVRNDVEKLLKGTTPVEKPVEPEVEVVVPITSNEEKIWNYLLKEFNNEFGVAGLMGNLKVESSFNPCNLQGSYEKSLGYTDTTYTKAVDNGEYSKEQFVNDKAGYGLAQWTFSSRKKNLYEFMKGAKLSIGDLEGQLEFLCKELQDYTMVWTALLNATSVAEASYEVLTRYEKPASMNSEKTQKTRASYGEAIFKKYAKHGGIIKNEAYVGKGIGTAIAGSNMNIRERPNLESKSYGLIKKGTQVEVLEILPSKWYKIAWPNVKEGYAYTSHVEDHFYTYTPNQKEEDPETKEERKVVNASKHAKAKDTELRGTYIVNTSSVNARDGAGMNEKILTSLPRGTLVNNYGYYTEVKGVKWLFVKFTHENVVYTAFISSKYLKKKV